MRGGGGDALDGGQFLRDEGGDLVQAVAVDDDQHVVTAGHEIAGFNLVVLGDALGQAVEPPAALRRQLDLDNRLHAVPAFGLVAEDRLIAEDIPVGLGLADFITNLVLGQFQHAGQIPGGQGGVLPKQLE